MIDKTLDIFLIVLFGAGGMAILLLAWIQPMSLSERILSTSIGAIGLFWMLLRTLQFKSIHACLKACTYSAPQFGVEPDAKMQKCDLCLDRWMEGKKPICVAACPMRAMDAGPVDELKARYGDVREAEGFVYSGKLVPSVVFKPKR